MSERAQPASAGLRTWLQAGRKWVIVLMLATLYAALMADLDRSQVRALLASHFGLFLLWQPFLSAERRLDLRTAVLMLIPGAALLISLSGWTIAVWLALLIGIIGGRAVAGRSGQQRLFYVLAFVFLLALLLLWVVPRQIVEQPQATEGFKPLVRYGLPLLLLAIAALRFEAEAPLPGRMIDFFYSLLLFQLVVLLVLGSIAMMRVTDDNYFLALAYWLPLSGCGLLALAVLWSPPAGFGGLRTYFSSYLMSVGVPSEQWLRRLAEIADEEDRPAQFLVRAMREVAGLPWICGGEWNSAEGRGEFGSRSAHRSDYRLDGLQLRLYSSQPLGPAIALHQRLLTQLLGEFYEGKRREQALKRNAYLQAVHETGARLTHDIKNLLQSLYALASGAQNADVAADPEYGRMLARQLPRLTQRLQVTLDKLQAPGTQTRGAMLSAGAWWAELLARYQERGVAFQGDFDARIPLPLSLFDSVADNLLDNALQKRQAGAEVAITATLATEPLSLTVCDTGAPIADALLPELFRGPVSDAVGLGIGLYQSYRQAEAAGYALSLAANEPGKVCFVLQQQSRGANASVDLLESGAL